MNVIVSNASDKPIYEQIYSQIKGAILRGEAKEGDALPSIRALAKELRISVITTKRAYEELEREGLIYTVPGVGCFVARQSAQLRREQLLRQMEEHLLAAVRLAASADVKREELCEMLTLFWQDTV